LLEKQPIAIVGDVAMRPTLQDMANILNLSKSTVSRALSGDPRVAEATRVRVECLAVQIGYTPNPIAQGLATRRTNTIGLAVPCAPRSLSDPFYLEFLGHAGNAAMKAGYSVLLSAEEEDGAGAHSAHVELAGSARVDGMILTEPKIRDERVEALKRARLPFVFLGMTRDQDVSWVSCENRLGSAEAVEGLTRLGHARIACLAGPADQTASEARYQGYCEALVKAGIPLDLNLVASGDFTQAGGYAAMAEILERGNSVSGVFASNDVMALGAMYALRERGLSIPEDVSVVGFDGIAFAQFSTPPLATVRQPIDELGRVAVEILIELIRGDNQGPVHRVLPARFEPAGSAAPPGGGALR
jgi:DNA-binding LacI/PurR family transcriptional regulator